MHPIFSTVYGLLIQCQLQAISFRAEFCTRLAVLQWAPLSLLSTNFICLDLRVLIANLTRFKNLGHHLSSHVNQIVSCSTSNKTFSYSISPLLFLGSAYFIYPLDLGLPLPHSVNLYVPHFPVAIPFLLRSHRSNSTDHVFSFAECRTEVIRLDSLQEQARASSCRCFIPCPT